MSDTATLAKLQERYNAESNWAVKDVLAREMSRIRKSLGLFEAETSYRKPGTNETATATVTQGDIWYLPRILSGATVIDALFIERVTESGRMTLRLRNNKITTPTDATKLLKEAFPTLSLAREAMVEIVARKVECAQHQYEESRTKLARLEGALSSVDRMQPIAAPDVVLPPLEHANTAELADLERALESESDALVKRLIARRVQSMRRKPAEPSETSVGYVDGLYRKTATKCVADSLYYARYDSYSNSEARVREVRILRIVAGGNIVVCGHPYVHGLEPHDPDLRNTYPTLELARVALKKQLEDELRDTRSLLRRSTEAKDVARNLDGENPRIVVPSGVTLPNCA